jgi:uncharacterized membrane protein
MAFWIVWNLIRGIPHFDPTFVILAMAASVEAIFLSTFVLISQDRAQAATDKRDGLNLHINLLAEHELTRLIEMVSAIAQKLEIRTGAAPSCAEGNRAARSQSLKCGLDIGKAC